MKPHWKNVVLLLSIFFGFVTKLLFWSCHLSSYIALYFLAYYRTFTCFCSDFHRKNGKFVIVMVYIYMCVSADPDAHSSRPVAILAMPRLSWTLLLPGHLKGACSAYDIPSYLTSLDPIGAPLLFNPTRWPMVIIDNPQG